MDSNYAYVHFLKPIGETDISVNGELLQFNQQFLEGETNLVSVAEYQTFQKHFPDRIKGNIIKKDNLLNMINYLYAMLKPEIEQLSEISDYTSSRIKEMATFEKNGILCPDHYTDSSIEDLANKFFILQYNIRKEQKTKLEASGKKR